MSDPILVEVVRSGATESTHLFDVAVVDRSGSLVAWAGDAEVLSAFRSSAKPIQARAALELGWVPADDAALAVACASHNGEPAHIEAARAILARAGLSEGALQCPPDVPSEAEAALSITARRAIQHNCSGKHAGMVAACVAANQPTHNYLARDHVLQVATHRLITEACGVVDPPVLVDGCGAPTIVAPLSAFARGFLAVDDGGPETKAMRAHPFLVGGTGRLDTDLMGVAPRLCVKSGAEGLTCVSDGEHGIALKSRDGAGRARGPAVLHVLDAMGMLVDARDLTAHRMPPVLGGGRPVGLLRASGRLFDR